MSKAVRRKDMRLIRQLERARELFPNKSISIQNLSDAIFIASSSDTKYIIYGIKDD